MNAFAGSLRDRNSSTGCLVTFVVRGKSFFFPPVGIRSGNSGSFDRAKDESDVARGRKLNSAFRVVECDQIAFTLVKTRDDRGLEFPRRFVGPASPTTTTRSYLSAILTLRTIVKRN